MGVSAMDSGITGIYRGMQSFTQNAKQIVNETTPTPDKDGDGDVEKPLVGLISDEKQVAASAKVIKTADEMIGSLLDEMA